MVGLIVSGFFTASALLSYVVAPDWMWMYFLEPDEARWTVPLMPFAYVATYVLGFAAGVSLKQLSMRMVWFGAAVALAAEAAVVALTWDRYVSVGSPETGEVYYLFDSPPAGPVVMISVTGAVFAVVLVAGLIWLWRQSRARVVD